MSTQVASTGLIAQSAAPLSNVPRGRGDDATVDSGTGMAKALAQVHPTGGAEAVAPRDPALSEALKLALGGLLQLGRIPTDVPIAVPETIAGDRHRRMVYKVGVQAARQLALRADDLSTEELIALGRQTVTDHVLSGDPNDVLVSLARSEGVLDESAWRTGNKDEIAGKVSAFLYSTFKQEFDLYDAVQELAAEPPLLGRRELADELLRQQDIDPKVLLDASDAMVAPTGVAAFAFPVMRSLPAGHYYFDTDRLTAAQLLKMRTPRGSRLSTADIDRVLGQLPDSLDAEFGRRFDAHKKRMSVLLGKWLAARLSLHARDGGIDMSGATVTISRVKTQYFTREKSVRVTGIVGYSALRSELPAQGFLVCIRSADAEHRCFVPGDGGAVQVLPAGGAAEDWLDRERSLVFQDAGTFADEEARKKGWLSRVVVQEMAAGTQAAILDWLPKTFEAEIEQGREAARGQTTKEGVADTLLNLIPFRAMLVALRKGDIPTAIVMGGLDVLSLIPLLGQGARLTGAAARSAMPWLGMGVRLGGRVGRHGLNQARLLVGGRAPLHGRIKERLVRTAAHGWGGLRPLDVQRMAAAVRSSSPRLAAMLDRVLVRASDAAIPDGVWRIAGDGVSNISNISNASKAAKSVNGDIGTIRATVVRNAQGGELSVLPYGNQAGAYTQVHAASRQRVGALLLADREGLLYQVMPVASLERYQVTAPDLVQALEGRRAGADGTIPLDGSRYVRLGDSYVQVIPDRAVSTGGQAIWRVVAPPGVVSDVVAYRLIHDTDKGVWRQAPAPGLLGGHTRLGWGDQARVSASGSGGARLAPGSEQLARYRAALVEGVQAATPDETEVLRALLARMEDDPRGRAILNAMCAYHELRGQAPSIVLRRVNNAAQPRPSIEQPVRGVTWNLDLQSLRFGTTDEAIRELGAVYNNMTGLLQNEDSFRALLSNGKPALPAELEQAWAVWLAQDPDKSDLPLVTPRQLAVSHLRQRLREMACYGGLDRSALATVLANGTGRVGARINLSHRSLDSVPPLPVDTKVLVVAHNSIQNWDHLPDGLTSLDVEETGIIELPPKLPATLVDLNLSRNNLAGAALVLPPALKRLAIGGNGLTALPRLPAGLQELLVHQNQLRTLPAELPSGLQLLEVSDNLLTELPTPLPATLKLLLARHNTLTQLPAVLPSRLEELDVSWNRLQSLPTLPDTLRVLEAGNNALAELPANLPRGMELIAVSHNQLRHLPQDLPASLALLEVQHNVITHLPDNIGELVSCTIHLDGNPIPIDSIPIMAEDRTGPRIFFFAGGHDPAQSGRTLTEVVGRWLAGRDADALARWDALVHGLGETGKTVEFLRFLTRLRSTASYHNTTFRQHVADWLVELSRPERRALLDDTLGVCQGATQTCEDRVVSTWNDMQSLRRNDDIRRGLYDDRVDEVVDIARQMFRIEVLTEIARLKERSLTVVDPVEVYLAYVVRLRESLGLTAVAPHMRFYEASGVTAADLEQALEVVRGREREEFDQFLVLDYEPWQTLLKRKDPQAYAEAEAQAHLRLETDFEPRLQEEVGKLGLDPDDAAVRADARKDLGPAIMREIRYGALSGLTASLRTAQG